MDPKPAAEPPGHTAEIASAKPNPHLLLAVGVVFLALSVAASLALVFEHIWGLYLPGCGAGSPCARAQASDWGQVPLVHWPVSHLGVAYFLGLAVAWPAFRRGAPQPLRWLLRIGVLLSLGFIAVMLKRGYVCPYCLAVHTGNIAFWLLTEFTVPKGRFPTAGRHALPLLGSTFVLATVGLGIVERYERRTAVAVAEHQAQQSTAEILTAATRPVARPAPTATAASAPTIARQTATTQSAPAFTGRYRLGPAAAPIRFVIFMDYQCKGCNLVEHELKSILDSHPNISLSVKQWPGNRECNPHGDEDTHVYSCRAARVAETAGLLHGNDGFWQMHFWLFDQSARFTDEELRAKLREFGYDVPQFERTMQSDAIMSLIRADIDEAFDLGMASTPMIFINGHEFKGWQAPLALTKVVDALEKAKLPVRTAEADHPEPAQERFVANWRESKVRPLPTAGRAWRMGPDAAAVKIMLWGDYQQPRTALADGIIRDFLSTHPDAQYTFRHYPSSPQCNPAVKDEESPLACRAARVAEAAGVLGGNDAFWKMHVWLLAQHPSGAASQPAQQPSEANALDDAAVRDAGLIVGLDPDALLATLNSAPVTAAIQADAAAGQKEELQHVPLIFINGKVVPRWLHGDRPLLRPILDAAATPQK